MTKIIDLLEFSLKKASKDKTARIIQHFKDIRNSLDMNDMEKEINSFYPNIRDLTKLIERSKSDKLD